MLIWSTTRFRWEDPVRLFYVHTKLSMFWSIVLDTTLTALFFICRFFLVRLSIQRRLRYVWIYECTAIALFIAFSLIFRGKIKKIFHLKSVSTLSLTLQCISNKIFSVECFDARSLCCIPIQCCCMPLIMMTTTTPKINIKQTTNSWTGEQKKLQRMRHTERQKKRRYPITVKHLFSNRSYPSSVCARVFRSFFVRFVCVARPQLHLVVRNLALLLSWFIKCEM